MVATFQTHLFQVIFSKPHVASKLLCTLLPEDMIQHLDWDSLEVQPDSFLDEALHAYYADMLFTIRYDGRPAIIYLLYEHHSPPDPLLPFRLVRSMADAWLANASDSSPTAQLPVIIPVVMRASDDNTPETSPELS